MIGAIYGDIAGSKYEFNNIKTTNFNLLDEDCYFTDDTVCTIAVMDWLLHAKKRNEKTATEYMLKWTRKYPNRGYGGRFKKWIYSADPQPYGSYGNGAAMRISPIAWVAKGIEELEELSNIVTCITHNHPEALKGAFIVAKCIYYSLHGYDKGFSQAEIEIEYPKSVNFTYEVLKKTFRFDESCQNTVPEAIFCFLHSKSFEDCAKLTIALGGDCDTTAAISCAIAEAYYGVSEEHINRVKHFLTDEMNSIVDEFANRYGVAYGQVPVISGKDPYNVNRFVKVVRDEYNPNMYYLETNKPVDKSWIRKMFPQLKGVDNEESIFDLSGIEEARAYYNQELLHDYLYYSIYTIYESVREKYGGAGLSAHNNLQPCLTLFWLATKDELFMNALDMFYEGKLDKRTLELLNIKEEEK